MLVLACIWNLLDLGLLGSSVRFAGVSSYKCGRPELSLLNIADCEIGRS